MKKFTPDHEWIQIDNGVGTVGITHHAQSELGDIVFVELPEIGAQLQQGDEAAVIESVKAAGEIKSPVSGEIIAVNEALIEQSGLINDAAESDGWVYQIRLSDPSELDTLMDQAAYQQHIGA